ncbi:type IV secretory system conjugative DNA transfer family protein [Geodermatophilus obscurus]|uniref:Type IV secretory pathway VirD4 protein-like protein n=1 Tax=Geodermatophilus obscurus (strain ATCC 25078 / DSM 43160 / JCM 3152 / CCUG 61914 / KCC A-0152 / KCTC 9177 / NBRC 13315 / NRRL B-3577 / G-20) TaxID=526225 RepID=D2S844_GEOOG|nr:TraM recognition domain-containing protein [Geodermatophilus obscurus]ADB73466.1 Type IV secretory pathway VirD4 protein-like protein [Geodermatophilus obscurus DSM 43160]
MSVGRSQPDVGPTGWEVPTAVALVWMTAGALLLPAGRAAAALLTGGGWVWPHGSAALVASVGGLLAGDPAAGLDGVQVAALPSSPVMYAVIAGALGLFLAGSGGAAWAARRLLGGRSGMASRAHVADVLGRARLRQVAPVVRPDLTPDRRREDRRFTGTDVGWRLGRAAVPAAGELWVPYDRTTGVYGPQGSGKTLDLLAPALLDAPGAALVTLTKAEDLLLTLDARADGDRPVAVLDPFGAVPGLAELVWDPVAGCADPMVAERRAKAFTAGTVAGAVTGGVASSAARFYAFEAAKVLQAFLHAAALIDGTVEDVLTWAAHPQAATQPADVLRGHPDAAPFWDGLLHGALHGDPRAAGNTATTVQQALALFFQADIRRRCTPGPGRPATDIADLLAAGGTIYLLGREDPYASASPLMTAVAEHVLDTALQLAATAPTGRLCPPLLACLDELPSTAPLPTLRTRMANDRALGVSFLYAAQTWRQLVCVYGEDEARTLFGLTNVVVAFGGGKDGAFYRELSDLLGTTRVRRTSYSYRGAGWSRSTHGETVQVLRGEEIRQLPPGRALVVAENAPPLIARLTRCLTGPRGLQLLAAQGAARARVTAARAGDPPRAECTGAAHYSARPAGPAPAQRSAR